MAIPVVMVNTSVVLDHPGIRKAAPPFIVTAQTGAVAYDVPKVAVATVPADGNVPLVIVTRPRAAVQVVLLTQAAVPPVPAPVPTVMVAVDVFVLDPPFAAGKTPVTSAVRLTSEEVTVCVLPAKCAMPTPGEDATTQVAQAIVPVDVIVPPVIGLVVAMLVTVPLGAPVIAENGIVVDAVTALLPLP